MNNEPEIVSHQLHIKLVLLPRTSLAIAHAKLSLRSEVRIGRLGGGLYTECFVRFAIDQEKVRREKRSSRSGKSRGILF